MLKRIKDWPEALASEMARVQNMPFEWGKNDCCLFACNAVKAITGKDLARSFRGYKTRNEAFDLIKSFGGIGKLAESVAKKYSIPEIDPLLARRGDVCLLDAGRGETLGICVGDTIVAPGDKGLVGFPLMQGLRAWRIGGEIL